MHDLTPNVVRPVELRPHPRVLSQGVAEGLRDLTKLSRLLFPFEDVYVTAASPSKVAFDPVPIVDNKRFEVFFAFLVLVTPLTAVHPATQDRSKQ